MVLGFQILNSKGLQPVQYEPNRNSPTNRSPSESLTGTSVFRSEIEDGTATGTRFRRSGPTSESVAENADFTFCKNRIVNFHVRLLVFWCASSIPGTPFTSLIHVHRTGDYGTRYVQHRESRFRFPFPYRIVPRTIIFNDSRSIPCISCILTRWICVGCVKTLYVWRDKENCSIRVSLIHSLISWNGHTRFIQEMYPLKLVRLNSEFKQVCTSFSHIIHLLKNTIFFLSFYFVLFGVLDI
ncbi:hypothetical protein LXL04_014053 [Taraxacum kok-saghyz]